MTTTTTGVIWETAEQVAERLDCDVSTVREKARDGRLHGHQNGFKGRWRFHPAAVDAHVQDLDDRAQREACGCARLRAVRGG